MYISSLETGIHFFFLKVPRIFVTDGTVIRASKTRSGQDLVLRSCDFHGHMLLHYFDVAVGVSVFSMEIYRVPESLLFVSTLKQAVLWSFYKS